MNQDFISQTPLDQITGTDYGQMLKAAIPYLPARSRQILSIYEKAMEFPKKTYTKWFDCDKIKGTPVVRTRQTGDYITLENGSRKPLRRFMIDEKIPADKRDEIALLADGDHIMWIIGRRISSYYKIGPDTRRVLQAKVSQSTLS